MFRFEEHDIYLPMITLEELDGHKKGMSEVARNARQVSREFARRAGGRRAMPPGTQAAGICRWRTGPPRGQRPASCLPDHLLDVALPAGLPQGKADNQILGVVQRCASSSPREVVLVSKDINMRIKARALGLQAEDYFNDKTLEDGDLLYTGVLQLPGTSGTATARRWRAGTRAATPSTASAGPLVPLRADQPVRLSRGPGARRCTRASPRSPARPPCSARSSDYHAAKNAVWGVTARNREQNFALNLLMDPDCDFVTLTGTAGTGKTLMTLAAALSQVLDDPLHRDHRHPRDRAGGRDIGFLPGNEEEKMNPWMGALDDNLEVLARGDTRRPANGAAATNDLVRSKIKIKSLNFMRGRTFLNKFVIIDEAQNLTPKQMKTLITRAGPGTRSSAWRQPGADRHALPHRRLSPA